MRYVEICTVSDDVLDGTRVTEKIFSDLGVGWKNLFLVYKGRHVFQMKDLPFDKAEKIIPSLPEEAEKLRNYLQS